MEWMLAKGHSSDEEWSWWEWVLTALLWGTLIWLGRKKRGDKVRHHESSLPRYNPKYVALLS